MPDYRDCDFFVDRDFQPLRDQRGCGQNENHAKQLPVSFQTGNTFTQVERIRVLQESARDHSNAGK